MSRDDSGWLIRRACSHLGGEVSANRLAAVMLERSYVRPPPKPRSLGNRIRQLDQGDARWWLKAENRNALDRLSAVLSVSSAELRRLASEHERIPSSQWSLDVLGDVPPLELASAWPFPGIPKQVLNPEHWGTRLLWYAPSGAGRTLVGRWLEARSVAVFVTADRLDTALDQAKGEAKPIFVELSAAADEAEIHRQRVPNDLQICVAVPFAGPEPVWTYKDAKDPERTVEAESTQWNIVRSPSPDAWREDLVEWISKQIPASFGFDHAGTSRWLRHLTQLGLLSTPGEALTFAGVLQAHGLAAIEQMTGEELLNAHVVQVTERTDIVDEGARDWLQSSGSALLIDAAHRALEEGLDIEGRGLRESEWRGILRGAAPPRKGVEKVRRRLLALDGNDLSRKEIKELARALTPDSKELVPTLIHSGLLARVSPGRFAVRPAWIARVLNGSAVERIIDEPLGRSDTCTRWARIALEHGAIALDVAWYRVKRGELGFIEAALSAFDRVGTGDIAAALGAEASFVIVGLSALLGDSFDEHLLRRLWLAQSRLAVPRWDNWPPVPRTIVVDGERSHAIFQTHWAYVVAAWAISERLPSTVTADAHHTLVPWRATRPTDLDDTFQMLRNVESHRLVVEDDVRNALLDLFGRLYERTCRAFDANELPARLLLPAFVRGMEPANERLEELERETDLASALVREASRTGIAHDDVFERLWLRWISDPARSLSTTPPFRFDDSAMGIRASDEARRFWRSVPIEILRLENVVRVLNGRWTEKMGDLWVDDHDRWRVWLETTIQIIARKALRAGASTPFRLVPLPLLTEHIDALAEPTLLTLVLPRLWEEAQDVLVEHLEGWCVSAPETAISVMWSSRSDRWPNLLDCASRLVDDRTRLTSKQRERLLGWLHAFVEARHSSWRESYALLDRMTFPTNLASSPRCNDVDDDTAQ